jgi:hypothetical protein
LCGFANTRAASCTGVRSKRVVEDVGSAAADGLVAASRKVSAVAAEGGFMAKPRVGVLAERCTDEFAGAAPALTGRSSPDSIRLCQKAASRPAMMLNLYEAVRSNPSFNKLEIGDLVFAEYTCPVDQARLGEWSHTDYLVHVLSGRKTWHTSDGAWRLEAGDTVFVRKGAAIIEQFFEVDSASAVFHPGQPGGSTVRNSPPVSRAAHPAPPIRRLRG